LGSSNLPLRKGALNHYDTIFCYYKEYSDEIRATERLYGLQEKNLIDVGFGLLDQLIENYNNSGLLENGLLENRHPEKAHPENEHPGNDKPQILVAPSWQKDNILEYCLKPLLEGLLKLDADIIIRPHPEFVKRFPEKVKAISDKYSDKKDAGALEIQTDFSSNSTVYNSDLVITDWSSIAQEFSLTTKKPSLFINTPMKVMNLEWRKIGIEPMDIWIRDRIGVSVDTDKLGDIDAIVLELLDHKDDYAVAIEAVMSEHLFNMGHTDEAGGEYIIKQICNKRHAKQ